MGDAWWALQDLNLGPMDYEFEQSASEPSLNPMFTGRCTTPAAPNYPFLLLVFSA
jgi:hypothetical protein